MQVNGLETLLFSLSLRERVGVRARSERVERVYRPSEGHSPRPPEKIGRSVHPSSRRKPASIVVEQRDAAKWIP